MSQLIVSSSPHIRRPDTTRTIMRDVLIALLPAAVAAVLLFGLPALLVILTCVGSAVLFEAGYQLLMKKPVTVTDGSAAVTGLLLAFCLPSNMPIWMAIIGSFIAIVIVKQLFGGLGANFANPALVARIVLMLSFSDAVSANFLPAFPGVDAVASATPLATNLTGASVKTLLLGFHGGSLGEVCAVALLAGGLYLIIRRVITLTIPLVLIGSMVAFGFLFGASEPLLQPLVGGALLSAFFMATDYVTSPMRESGKAIYAVGIALITMAIRVFGNYDEGISFAILIFNIITPHIDNMTKSKPLGGEPANG